MKNRIIFLCLIIILSMAQLSFGQNSFILGEEEGDGQLVSPTGLKEGPDGNIYVYDQKDAFIKVYNPTGKFIAKMGGKGEGPGEIKRVEGVDFGFTNDNRLFFTEFYGGHQWITLMSLKGKYLDIIKPQISRKMGCVEQAVALKDGTFLIEFAYWPESEKKSKYYLQAYPTELCHVDSKGQILSIIKKTNFFTRISYMQAGADLGIPYAPTFMWNLYKDDMVILAESIDKNLKISNFKGEIIDEIKTTLPEPQKVGTKDLERWRKNTKEMFSNNQRSINWYNRFGKVIEDYTDPIYTKKPLIKDISVTPSDYILITILPDELKKEKRFILLDYGKDKKINTLAEINLEAIMIKFTKHFLFVQTVDEDENEIIKSYKRSGSDAEDMLKIIKN